MHRFSQRLAMAVGLLCLTSSAVHCGDKLTDLWTDARRGGEYREVGRDEMRRATELFKKTFAEPGDLEELQRSWQRLEFELTVLTHPGIKLLVLHEKSDHKRGRGFYVFRSGVKQAIVLQAPHSWDDAHTGQIALSLFREGKVRAGAWNTVSRKSGDLAHLSSSYYQAFTQAFAESYRLGILVQLHGFDTYKRKSDAGKEADLVVSHGTKQPPAWLLDVARRWKDAKLGAVKVYPREVNELGALTNAQSLLLQSLGSDVLVHVEIGPAQRRRLREDAEVRKAFLDAVTATCGQFRDNSKK